MRKAENTIGTIAILLALLSTSAPAPPFSATWRTPTSATIQWTQPPSVHLTCLSRNTTLIRCWVDAPPGGYVIALGAAGPLDHAFRPQPHDVFTLEQDGTRQSARLVGLALLPLVRA